jgi:hypothetical protein
MRQMLKLHKIGLVAAILGSAAALGVDAGVSHGYSAGDKSPDNCTENNGSIRCEQTSKYHYHTSDGGSMTVTSKATQTYRNEQKERPAAHPISVGKGEVAYVGSICVQRGPHFKMPSPWPW